MPSTPNQRKLAAKIGAHSSWANTDDRPGRTAAARAARDAKFLEQADGDPVRAEHLRRAFFARLALASAKSRQAKAKAKAKVKASRTVKPEEGKDDAA